MRALNQAAMELDPRGPCPSAAAWPRAPRLAGQRLARSGMEARRSSSTAAAAAGSRQVKKI